VLHPLLPEVFFVLTVIARNMLSSSLLLLGYYVNKKSCQTRYRQLNITMNIKLIRKWENTQLITVTKNHPINNIACPSARPSVHPPVRPSVCLSVTRVYQSKTVVVRIMQLSPQSSPMTLVSWRLTLSRKFKGNVRSEGAELERGREK